MAFLKSIWKANGRHKKLSEELALQNAKETESEGEQIELIEDGEDVITFKLKYLGSTVVEKLVGENINTESVKNIIKVAKAARKKLQRVNIAISLKGIAVSDLQGNDLFKISIYRISNCSTDPTHRQVFSFVSTDENETMECHAFICSKRKMADTVTLAVAKAFSTAYEAWRILPSTKEFERNTFTTIIRTPTKTTSPTAPPPSLPPSPPSSPSENVLKENAKNQMNKIEVIAEKLANNITEEKLIDFDDEPEMDNDPATFAFGNAPHNDHDTFNTSWVCFDDDFGQESQRNLFQKEVILA